MDKITILEELHDNFINILKNNVEELKWWQRLPIIRNYYMMWCYIEAFEFTLGGFEE